MRYVVETLRGLADGLRAARPRTLLLPDKETEDERYPLDLQPGCYDTRELAKALQFLADMLEE